MRKFTIQPVTLKAAAAFIKQYHRHHPAPRGCAFCLAAADATGEIIGVCVVGRPVSRVLDADAFTAEVTRLCVREGYPHACSFLYGAAWKAARAIGYTRLVTYILASESGVSVTAANGDLKAIVRGKSWSCPTRQRSDVSPTCDKKRYEWEVQNA